MKKNTKKTDIIIITVMLLIVAAFLCSIVGKKESTETSSKESMYTSFEDLKQARIGVMTGSAFDELIHDYFSEGNISYYNSEQDMALAISTGKLDAFVTDESIAKELKAANADITYLPESLGTTPYGIAFAKNEKSDRIRM